MLEAIKTFIQNIGNFFSTLWTFVIEFFEGLVFVVKTMATIVPNIPSYFSWLPAAALTLVVTAIGLVVAYKIIGRTH